MKQIAPRRGEKTKRETVSNPKNAKEMFVAALFLVGLLFLAFLLSRNEMVMKRKSRESGEMKCRTKPVLRERERDAEDEQETSADEKWTPRCGEKRERERSISSETEALTFRFHCHTLTTKRLWIKPNQTSFIATESLMIPGSVLRTEDDSERWRIRIPVGCVRSLCNLWCTGMQWRVNKLLFNRTVRLSLALICSPNNTESANGQSKPLL